jgi:hypothetical protein
MTIFYFFELCNILPQNRKCIRHQRYWRQCYTRYYSQQNMQFSSVVIVLDSCLVDLDIGYY